MEAIVQRELEIAAIFRTDSFVAKHGLSFSEEVDLGIRMRDLRRIEMMGQWYEQCRLSFALEHMEYYEIKALLDLGVPFDIRGALQTIVYRDMTDVFDLFMDRGCTFDNSFPSVLFRAATQSCSDQLFRRLLDRGLVPCVKAFCYALVRQRFDLCDLMIIHGFNIHSYHDVISGCTQVPQFQYLIDHGVALNNYYTIFRCLVLDVEQEVLVFLREQGIDANITDCDGRSAWDINEAALLEAGFTKP